jgi:hypothetical protein
VRVGGSKEEKMRESQGGRVRRERDALPEGEGEGKGEGEGERERGRGGERELQVWTPVMKLLMNDGRPAFKALMTG